MNKSIINHHHLYHQDHYWRGRPAEDGGDDDDDEEDEDDGAAKEEEREVSLSDERRGWAVDLRWEMFLVPSILFADVIFDCFLRQVLYIIRILIEYSNDNWMIYTLKF